MEEQFRELAEKLVSTMSAQSGVELGYDDASVEWVDGFIERQRVRFVGDEAAGLVNVIGAFVGECIIRNFGGSWREDEGTWGISFSEGNMAYPFANVRKQFDNGREAGDSVHGFYRVIPLIFARPNDAE